jgi:transcriptional regulator with XRE-family HTH domain
VEPLPEAFGPRLRALRVRQQLSLSAFARKVFYTKGYLSRVETGAQVPSAEFVRKCESALGVDGVLTAVYPGNARDPAPEPAAPARGEEVWIMTLTPNGSAFTPIGRREALLGGAAIVAGATLSRWPTAVASPGEQLDRHRLLFDTTRELGQTSPPSSVLPMLVGQAHALRRLSQDTSGRVVDELGVLAARTAEFAGWMAQEDGDDEAALWWTDRAVQVATAVGDDYMAGYALVRRALITMNRGDAAATISLAQQARSRSGLPARIRGLAAQREAQGHALAGDYDACMRALDEAGRLLRGHQADLPAGPVIGTAHVTDPVAVATGWCLHDLGRPREAAEVLDRELAHIPASAIRARTRFGARRALAHAESGELEHACLLAREIVENLAHIQSATITADVRRFARTVRRWPANEHVRALTPALTAALTYAT